MKNIIKKWLGIDEPKDILVTAKAVLETIKYDRDESMGWHKAQIGRDALLDCLKSAYWDEVKRDYLRNLLLGDAEMYKLIAKELRSYQVK